MTIIESTARIFFSLLDIEVRSNRDDALFNLENGNVTALAEGCTYRLLSDSENGDGQASIMLDVTGNAANVLVSSGGEFSVWDSDYLFSVSVSSDSIVEFNASSGFIQLKAVNDGNASIVGAAEKRSTPITTGK